MVVLPVELLPIIFSFIQNNKDAASCALICKAWNFFATIRLYEAGVKLEALRTLWTRRDLAALVKDVKLVAWEHRSTFALEMSMDDSELLAVLEDAKTVRALREGYVSAYIVLLIKLLPSLRTLDITPFDSSLLWDIFPAIYTLSDASNICTLRHLTSLQVTGYNGGMRHHHGLPLTLLVRCMSLPSLISLTFQIVDGMELREEIQRVLPDLYGTSSVEHLRLHDLSLVTDDFIAPLLRIPRRLRTFGLTHFRAHKCIGLGSISNALQHVRKYLEVLEIYHDVDLSDPTGQSQLTNLHQFPLLTHLTAPMKYITGRLQQSAALSSFDDLLPPSLTFWNIRVTGLYFSRVTIVQDPLVFEKLASLGSLKHLCLNTRWDRSAELWKRWNDTAIEITYDMYDGKQHTIVDEKQQPIFRPGDLRNLGGCYGSPFMSGAADEKAQDWLM